MKIDSDKVLTVILLIIILISFTFTSFRIGKIVGEKQGYQEGVNDTNYYYDDFKLINIGVSGKNLTIYQDDKTLFSVRDSKINYVGFWATCKLDNDWIEIRRQNEITIWNKTLTKEEADNFYNEVNFNCSEEHLNSHRTSYGYNISLPDSCFKKVYAKEEKMMEKK